MQGELFFRASTALYLPFYRSESPKTYAFDRFFPHDTLNSSLPLVVLYAAPTDEALPELYNALHALAEPASGRPARLQFAIRWRPDPKLEQQSYEPDWRVEAAIKDGYEAPQIESGEFAFLHRLALHH